MNQQFRMTKQMIDMQKASFDGMINGLISMWDQTGGVFEGASWLPEEGRKALKQWVDINKKACENLKSDRQRLFQPGQIIRNNRQAGTTEIRLGLLAEVALSGPGAVGSHPPLKRDEKPVRIV